MAGTFHSHESPVNKLLNILKHYGKDACSFDEDHKIQRSKIITPSMIQPLFETDLELMLRAIFKHRSATTITEAQIPVTTTDVSRKYSRVLCILALLPDNKLHFLPRFTERPSLRDELLPFTSEDPPKGFPPDTQDTRFYAKFQTEQWQFCAPRIEPQFGQIYEPQILLPFKWIEEIPGAPNVYKVSIHPEYDGLEGSNGRSRASGSADHVYAVKVSYGKDDVADHRREVNLYKRLTEAGEKQPPGIVACYGSFECRNNWYMLLEYADLGTLEDYMQTIACPSGDIEALELWESIFKLVSGLEWIHEHKLPVEQDGGATLEQACHQDLKPTNILVFPRGAPSEGNRVLFKIADFGVGHIQDAMNGADVQAPNNRGIYAYGAPECSKQSLSSGQRSTTVKCDIWSIGCIMSEVAVYSTFGIKGLRKYRGERMLEISRIQTHHVRDAFHDGDTVLTAVKDAHRKIVDAKSGASNITVKVVGRLIDLTLRDKPTERPYAPVLTATAKRILSEAEPLVKEFDLSLLNKQSNTMERCASTESLRASYSSLLVDDALLNTPPSSVERSASTGKARKHKGPDMPLIDESHNIQTKKPFFDPRKRLDHDETGTPGRRMGAAKSPDWRWKLPFPVDISWLGRPGSRTALYDRGHVFLIDNSASMEEQAMDVIKLVSTMVSVLQSNFYHCEIAFLIDPVFKSFSAENLAQLRRKLMHHLRSDFINEYRKKVGDVNSSAAVRLVYELAKAAGAVTDDQRRRRTYYILTDCAPGKLLVDSPIMEQVIFTFSSDVGAYTYDGLVTTETDIGIQFILFGDHRHVDKSVFGENALVSIKPSSADLQDLLFSSLYRQPWITPPQKAARLPEGTPTTYADLEKHRTGSSDSLAELPPHLRFCRDVDEDVT